LPVQAGPRNPLARCGLESPVPERNTARNGRETRPWRVRLASRGELSGRPIQRALDEVGHLQPCRRVHLVARRRVAQEPGRPLAAPRHARTCSRAISSSPPHSSSRIALHRATSSGAATAPWPLASAAAQSRYRSRRASLTRAGAGSPARSRARRSASQRSHNTILMKVSARSTRCSVSCARNASGQCSRSAQACRIPARMAPTRVSPRSRISHRSPSACAYALVGSGGCGASSAWMMSR